MNLFFISIHSRMLQRVAALALLSVLFSVSSSYGAQQAPVPIRLVTIITLDDQGAKTGFPYELAYDPLRKETYLVSGTGRLTVYDHKYFPVGSFGKGRGLVAPQGIAVDSKGNVYVCIGDKAKESTAEPQLAIYNPAFFLEKRIVFSEIPELKNFTARKVAVNNEGLIYLTGGTLEGGEIDNSGAVVLSPEGKFLRRVTPMDLAPRSMKKKPPAVADAKTEESADKDSVTVEELPEGLAEIMRPAASERDQDEDDDEDRQMPVYLDDVVIDENGRIYLLSGEMGHIYVYNAREEFLFKFGEKGGADRKLSTPKALAVDFPRRVIYVVDYMRHTILSYDYDTGKYIFEFGGRGLSPLWFNFPRDIAVDTEGRVIVADVFNNRTQVIDPNMETRRPLAGLLAPEMETGELPASEKEPEVEIAEPARPVLPADVAEIPSPSATMVPEVPVRLAGIIPVKKSSLQPFTPVPDRPKPPPVKMIGPDKSKKAAERKPVVPEKEAMVSAPEPEPMQRILRLPASLGVYGPIAALGVLGGWFLYRNR